MYQPPYPPIPVVQRTPLQEYRRGLRKSVNRLSWIILAGLALMSLLYMLFPAILWGIGYPVTDPNFEGFSEEMYFLISCLYYLIGLFFPFFFFQLASGESFNKAIPFKKFPFRLFFPCIFLGLAVCLAANYPANFVYSLFEYIGLPIKLPETPIPTGPIGIALYVLSISIIPALVEEFAFRGVVLSRLRKYGDGFAVIVSSLLFALFHSNPIQLLFAFICGFILSFLVLRTQNLFPAILIHALNNACSVLFELLYASCEATVVDQVYTIVFLAVIVLGLASFLFLAIREKGFFRPSRETFPVRLSTRFGTLFANPGFWALLVNLVATTVLMTVSF